MLEKCILYRANYYFLALFFLEIKFNSHLSDDREFTLNKNKSKISHSKNAAIANLNKQIAICIPKNKMSKTKKRIAKNKKNGPFTDRFTILPTSSVNCKAMSTCST